MKRTLVLVVCLVFLVLSGHGLAGQSIVKPSDSESVSYQRNDMLGKWFGDTTGESGEIQRWLLERYKDGTYKVDFKIYKDKKVSREQTEVGLWGIAGPIYFTITKGWFQGENFIPADPSQPYFYDAYEILNFDGKTFSYRSYTHNMSFEVKKVKDDFQWPEVK